MSVSGPGITNNSEATQNLTSGPTLRGVGGTNRPAAGRMGALNQGLVPSIISNTSANPISRTFSNLSDGSIVTINGNNFQATYSGGDWNDLTLTVVP